MNNLQAQIKKLRDFAQNYDRNRVTIALESASFITDLVVERVREKRLRYDGNVFGLYKDSTWKRKQKRTDDRRINFSDTNLMMNSTKPIVEAVTKDQVSVLVQPNKPDRLEVMGHLEEKFGPIIKLSEREENDVAEFYQSKYEKLTNQL